MHSIEDTQIDQLTSSSLTVPPPADNTSPLSPNDTAAPTADYVTEETDVGVINDDIRQIIAARDEPSEDEEEREEEEEKQDSHGRNHLLVKI